MRRLILCLVLGLVGIVPAWAQYSYAKFEVFGGFSFANTGLTFTRKVANGWGVSVTKNVDKHVGLTVDFATQYGSQPVPLWRFEPGGLGPCGLLTPCVTRQGFAVRQFLFGPTVVRRKGAVTLFAHQLFGVSKSPAVRSFNTTNFAMGFGGGLDAAVSDRIAIRFFQVDYVPTHLSSGWAHDIRFQTGIVLKFGARKNQ